MRGHLRKRGSAWELRAYAGSDPKTHRDRYVTRTFHGGKRDAEDALARFVLEVGGRTNVASDVTLGDLIHDWLELALPTLSPTTAKGYQGIIDRYIAPTIGSERLAKLTTVKLDRFYANLHESGGEAGRPLSPASVRQVHAVIRRALLQAVRWGWLTSNPAVLASPPKLRRPELAPPEPGQVVQLIRAAAEEDPDFSCFLHVAATTGARRGELCALRWKDVDSDRGVLTIAHAVVVSADRNLLEKDTKTHAARRISLDPDTLNALRAHRERVDNRVTACGAVLRDDAYVFSGAVDALTPWNPDQVTKHFVRLRTSERLGPLRLHDLRHFAATRLLAAGVPVRTVSGRLGHSNAATTLGVYAHFVEESDREAATTLGALLAIGPTVEFQSGRTPSSERMKSSTRRTSPRQRTPRVDASPSALPGANGAVGPISRS